jgi:hypothetical protein
MHNETHLILKPSYKRRLSFYCPKAKFNSTVQKGNIPKFYISKYQSTKTIRITKKISQRDFSTYEKILSISKYKKEKEKEKIRQKIEALIMDIYARKTPRDYNIGIINKILTKKQNKIKSLFIELLDIIEYKEILSHYYSREESVIKLSFLTKLNAINVKVFPNYAINEAINSIMTNNKINKANLLNRIEKSDKINELNMKLLNFINKENNGNIYRDEEEEEVMINKEIKRVMNSYSDKENNYLEENLNDLNNNSFSKNKSNSISKIQILIKDLSICLKKSNINNNDMEDINKSNKNNLKLGSNNSNNTNNNNNNKIINNIESIVDEENEKEVCITKKNKTINKTLTNNGNTIIRNLNFNNLFTLKQNQFKLTTISNNKNKNKTALKKSYTNNTHIQIDSEGNKNNNNKKNLLSDNLAESKRSSKNSNLYLKTNTRIDNSKIRKIISLDNKKSKSLPINKKFKSTKKFLLNTLDNSQEKEKEKLKKTIINTIKKFGRNRYNNNNMDDLFLQTKNDSLKPKNIFFSNEYDYDNNNLRKNPSQGYSNYISNLFKKVKVKKNYLLPIQTERIGLNVAKYMKTKNNSLGNKNNRIKLKINSKKLKNFVKQNS